MSEEHAGKIKEELAQGEPGSQLPCSEAGDRTRRVLAGVLIAAALVAFIVCLATDVFS
jgi:hypothetical protein